MTPAPTQHWYVAEVAVNHEAVVAFTLRHIEIEPFLALELDTQRVSARTKQREVTTRLWAPGYIFLRTTQDRLQDARRVRYVLDILSTPEGQPLTATESQMARFIAEHNRLLEEERTAYYRRQAKATQSKAKYKKMDKAVLLEYMRDTFGLEIARAA